MASNPSQPSQVGLFSTQISEQIGRLRALTHEDGAAAADAVALKRAVMATRLLSGSARILHLESLQQFLDELLLWLQKREDGPRPLNPTQSMILDSAIELEERILRQLEVEENDDHADLSAHDEELDELLGLIRRNAQSPATKAAAKPAAPSKKTAKPAAPSKKTAKPAATTDVPKREPKSGPAAVVQADAPAPEMPPRPVAFETAVDDVLASPPSDQPGPILETLGSLLSQLDNLKGGDDSMLTSQVLQQLGSIDQRLVEILRSHGIEAPTEAPEPQPVVEESIDAAAARDATAGFLRDYLTARRVAMGGALSFEIQGTLGDIADTMNETVNRVLEKLLDDVCTLLDEMRREEGSSEPPRVGVELLREEGRLRVVIRDNGPRMRDAPGLDVTDPLGLYRGLRHVRSLIEQLNGLISVEPQPHPNRRFELNLPADLMHQGYSIVDLGGPRIAVPWVLVEDVISTDGLLFHADTHGESFEHYGRQISLVDLSQHVRGLSSADEMAERVVIVGSVEKRLGLYCEDAGDYVEADRIVAAPKGWEDVTYGGLEVGSDVVPLFDVKRLFRFGGQGMMPESGSIHDPTLDSYVPTETGRFKPIRDDDAVSPTPTAGQTQPRTKSQAAAPRAGESEPQPQPQTEPKPVVEPELDRPIPQPTSTFPRLGATPRALLINQSDFRRKDLARSLEGVGFEVTATADLIGGLHYLDGHEVDLVVTDLRLGEHGPQNLSRLREAHPSLPIVLTSSVAREYAGQLADKTGADACWLEPFRASELEAILRALA